MEDNEVKRLSTEDSLIHAFLPTEDVNGLGMLINGNFSTDPSRRHLIFDEETKETIHNSALHFIHLLKDCFENRNINNLGIVNSILPHTDPRMLQYSKNSFVKLLLEQLKELDVYYFNQIKLPLNWLNLSDFSKLTTTQENLTFYNKLYSLNGLISLFKFLGASEIKFQEIIEKINKSDISILGCVQITKFIFKSILTYSDLNESQLISLKVFYSDGIRKSIREMDSNSKIDNSFISLLNENGLTELDINQALKKYSISISSNIVENKDITPYNSPNEKDSNTQKVNDWFNNSKVNQIEIKPQTVLKRWRSAEEQTLEILNQNGFTLEDVSKQNIGYDLSGYDPNGKDIQIEVKSITYPGQKFRLTNNEVAVAQVKQASYYVAIVRHTEEFLEISLISDPVNNLLLNRQCVQWIWECESYEYIPIKFPLNPD